jgi:hypothetical protein
MTKPKFDATLHLESNPQARKTYARPQLLRYGNISEITRSVGNMGSADNGSPPTHKTA